MEVKESRKFSAHMLNSHLTGERIWVSSLPLWHLAVWMLTWQGIEAFALTGPTFWYQDERGNERTTTITATAVLSGRKLAYFTLTDGDLPESVELKVQKAHATRLGAQLLAFSTKELYANSVEVGNRRDAHVLLYQAHGLRTAGWEAGVLLQARQGSATLGEVATALGLTWEQTCVGFLKCWLKEKMQWHIATDSLSHRLAVRIAEA